MRRIHRVWSVRCSAAAASLGRRRRRRRRSSISKSRGRTFRAAAGVQSVGSQSADSAVGRGRKRARKEALDTAAFSAHGLQAGPLPHAHAHAHARASKSRGWGEQASIEGGSRRANHAPARGIHQPCRRPTRPAPPRPACHLRRGAALAALQCFVRSTEYEHSQLPYLCPSLLAGAIGA